MKTAFGLKKAASVLSLLFLLLTFSSCGTGSGTGSASGTAAGSADAGSRSAGSAFNKTALNRRFPAYEYDGKDPVEKLVYGTESERNPIDKDGYFVVVSPKIIDKSQEQDFLKVFFLSSGEGYKIYGDNTVYMDSGWNFPVAVTYQKQPDGKYAMKKYEMPKDGGGYSDSIRAFCKTPVTGAEIKGLPERIMQNSGPGGDLNNNLQKYLRKNRIENVKMMNS